MNDESPEISDSFILEIASEAHVKYAEQISKMNEQMILRDLTFAQKVCILIPSNWPPD
jgi:hypothetical protein